MLANLDPFEPLVSQLARPATFAPATDVVVSEGDLILTMDVPGLTEDELSIEMLDGYLIVRGERSRTELHGATSLAHRERAFGAFERRIKVPDDVDPDAITADLSNGVLSLIVPKPERMKPRTIEIGATSGQRELTATS